MQTYFKSKARPVSRQSHSEEKWRKEAALAQRYVIKRVATTTRHFVLSHLLKHACSVAVHLRPTYAEYSSLLRCCLAHVADVAGIGALMGEGEMGAIAFRLHLGMARLTMRRADGRRPKC
jgi:hypothetical protein